MLLAVVAGLGLGPAAAGPASAGAAVRGTVAPAPVSASVLRAGDATVVAAGRTPSGPVAQLGARHGHSYGHYHSSYGSSYGSSGSGSGGGSTPEWVWAIVGVALLVALLWWFARNSTD